MPVSFVIENLSCEFALVNRSSKIYGNSDLGPLLVRVLELLCWLQSDYSWVGHSLTFVFSRKFVHHGQIISQQFSVKTKCKSELVFQRTPAKDPYFHLEESKGLKGFHLLSDNLGTGSVGCLIECNQSNALF